MDDRPRCLIFDPFAGISGDMILGALIDLGLGSDWLESLVHDLPVRATVSVTRVMRGGLSGQAVTVRSEEEPASRRLNDLLELAEAASIDPAAKRKAEAVFRRLAEVEGSLHGQPPEEIHFHEVGAVDAVVDVLGACAGVAALGVSDCRTRPVAVGRGWIETQHGKLALPAPATLSLLEGIPVRESGFEDELTTPTGAALLAALTEGRGADAYVPLRSGFGAGQRDPHDRPNCLRLILAEPQPAGSLCLLQADLDDMSPEYLPPLFEALRGAGAVDVWTHPLQMKKGRTGLRLEALAPEARRLEVSRALFEGSTTLGLRFWAVDREVLPRSTRTVEWRGQPIRVKISTSPSGNVRHKAEYDDVIEAARAVGVPPFVARREIELQIAREFGS